MLIKANALARCTRNHQPHCLNQTWRVLDDRLQPVWDGFGKLRDPRGALLCEIFEEPGIGQGVPGKIGRYLNRHPNSVDLGSDCCESASIMGFGTVTEVAVACVENHS